MYKFCMSGKLKPRKEFGTESSPCDVGIVTRAEGKQHNTIILVRTSEYNNAKSKAHCNKSRVPKMPNRCTCVVGGCSNVSNTKQGISLHFVPFAGDERPEARKRRKQCDFVRLKRAKWDPTPNSSIYSAHFAKDDFTQRFFEFLIKVTGWLQMKLVLLQFQNIIYAAKKNLSLLEPKFSEAMGIALNSFTKLICVTETYLIRF